MSKQPKPPKTGRPAMPAAKRQSSIISVRATSAERKAVEAQAEKAGLNLSDYVRLQLGLEIKLQRTKN